MKLEKDLFTFVTQIKSQALSKYFRKGIHETRNISKDLNLDSQIILILNSEQTLRQYDIWESAGIDTVTKPKVGKSRVGERRGD